MRIPITVITILLVILTIGCTPVPDADTGTGDDPPQSSVEADENGENGENDVNEEEPGEREVAIEEEVDFGAYPFQIKLNGTPVDSDLTTHVRTGEFVSIEFNAREVATGQLSVQHPGGETIPIGEWHADFAHFVQQFPEGENHMLITFRDTVYDIKVISETEPAEEDEADTTACSGAYIEFNPELTFEYLETSHTDVPAPWYYNISGWEQDDEGTVAFTLKMERRSGVEQNISRSTAVLLECRNDMIYIHGSTDMEAGITWEVSYDEDSVWLPPYIEPGVTWIRHGTLTIDTSDEVFEYDLTEQFGCVATETVSTEAGEFEAARVEYLIERISGTESLNHAGTWYLVQGIGRVLSIGADESEPRLELVTWSGM